MQQAEYTIPFYVKEDKSAAAAAERQSWLSNPNRKRKGWWEPLTTEDGLPPPEVGFCFESFMQQNCQVMIYEEYEFEFLGVEDENETAGDFASGSSPTSNLVAGANGELGGGKSGTEKDYRDFTLCFPTIKFPGSYAFTVTMWNGISNMMYNSSWNLTNPVFHSENITLLLPGGEGYVHETGKNDDGYCIQFPNGTKILDASNKEKCYSGNSLEVSLLNIGRQT